MIYRFMKLFFQKLMKILKKWLSVFRSRLQKQSYAAQLGHVRTIRNPGEVYNYGWPMRNFNTVLTGPARSSRKLVEVYNADSYSLAYMAIHKCNPVVVV